MLMEIVLTTSKKYQDKVVQSVRRLRSIKTGIKDVYKSKSRIRPNSHCVVIQHNKIHISKTMEEEIKKSCGRIKHVRSVSVMNTPVAAFRAMHKDRDCRFVFDIDSTLTEGKPGILARQVKSALNKLGSAGYWIHFATGRGDGDLRDIIHESRTEPQGIAENGGILVLSRTGVEKMGDRTGPDKAYKCLKKAHPRLIQDMEQHSRITERIIKKTGLTRKQCEKCTRKYKVTVIASQDAYHLVAKGVDKGSALRKLIYMRNWNDDFIVAVGDSDLDIPMFKSADASFAVANASPGAKEHASVVLDRPYAAGVEQMVDVWFTR